MQQIRNARQNKKAPDLERFLICNPKIGAGQGTLTPGLVLGKDAL
jgi:hypothetical protein